MSNEAFHAAARMIEEHFGPRCEDEEPSCLICQRWKLLDRLTESPYKGDSIEEAVAENWRVGYRHHSWKKEERDKYVKGSGCAAPPECS